MDIFGTAIGIAPLLGKYTASTEFEVTLLRCVRTAIRNAVILQLDDPSEEVSTAIVRTFPALTATRKFGRLAMDNAEVRLEWAREMRILIRKANVVESTCIDIDRLTLDFCDSYATEVLSAAKNPGSILFNSFMASQHEPVCKTSSQSLQLETPAQITNLWQLPLMPEPVKRPEVEEVRAILQHSSLITISGGPGAGKSTIARILAEQTQERGDRALIWWLESSSWEKLIASCDALITQVGLTPADDVVAQTKEFLAGHESWMLILDDVFDVAQATAILPNRPDTGVTIITTRSASLKLPGSEKRISVADESVMMRIAQSLMPSPHNETSLRNLVHTSDGNPLMIATICRYLATTGISTWELTKLIDSTPDEIFEERVGPHYPASFTEVIRRAIVSLEDSSAGLELITTLAICGGLSLPRDLLRRMSSQPAIQFNKALRELRDLGLVDFSDQRVTCHGLIATISLKTITPSSVYSAASQLLDTVIETAEQTGDAELRDLVSIVDKVLSHAPSDPPKQVLTHLTLARSLALHSLVISALSEISQAYAALPKYAPASVVAQVTLSEAHVHLVSGDSVRARTCAIQAIELTEGDETLNQIHAASLSVLAWSQEYLGDYAGARLTAQKAQRCAPSSHDQRAILTHFTIPTLPPGDQVAAYLALAENEGLSPMSRAQNFGQASRAAHSLSRYSEAVEYARAALELDSINSGRRTQYTARDLNDLGMALVETNELEEAEQKLRSSIEIYEEELSQHPFAVIPRTHLGRLLTKRSRAVPEPESNKLLQTAKRILEGAVEVQEQFGPAATEMAAALVALAETVPQHGTAIKMLNRALKIDRDAYGDSNIETGIDALKLSERYLIIGDYPSVLKTISVVKKTIPDWESLNPTLAATLLSLHSMALTRINKSSFQIAELVSLTSRLSRLLVHGNLDSETQNIVSLALQQPQNIHS